MSGSEQEENERYWASIEVPIRPVKQIKTQLFREKCLPRVREIFTEHGVTLEIKEDHCVVTLPDGATSQEVLPRLGYSTRHRIKLPDGYVLREVVQRNTPFSFLGMLDQDFSDC
jgi:hypothetical protein